MHLCVVDILREVADWLGAPDAIVLLAVCRAWSDALWSWPSAFSSRPV